MKDRQPGGCLPLFGLFVALGGVALCVYTWRLPPGSHSEGDMLFRGTASAVITGVGIVLMVIGRIEERGGRIRLAQIARHPDKRWFWRDDWEQGYARPDATSQAAMWLAIGALLLMVSAPLGLQLRDEVTRRENYAALAGLVFPIVGLFMVGKSVMSWLRHRKFANLRFVLSDVPGVLGGKLTGRIDGEFRLPAGTEVELVLSCVRSYISKSGTDRTRWQRVLWQDKKTALAFTGGVELASIPVEFEIPYDAQETDSRDTDNEILWRLAASSDVPGLDFHCEFQAPVFKTDASDAALTIAALETKSVARNAGIKPSDSRIESKPASSGRVRFYLAAGRHKGMAASLTVFGLLSMGSGLFFGYGLSQALSWIVGLIPLVIFGGLGLLLLLISFGLWFGSTTVEVINRELHVRRTYVVFSSTRVLTKDAIESFELHNSMQRGDEVWYDLRARLKTGRKRTICDGMEKSEAEWFLGEIKRDMGM